MRMMTESKSGRAHATWTCGLHACVSPPARGATVHDARWWLVWRAFPLFLHSHAVSSVGCIERWRTHRRGRARARQGEHAHAKEVVRATIR